MNELKKFFYKNKSNLIEKWDHYFDVYSDVFEKFRNKPIVLLEIGVNHGGSLKMWKNYFHPDSFIIGIDINPECKKFEENNIKVYIGSQSDRNFLSDLKNQIPMVDILIDDGGHTMNQQITSFECLFEHINDNGIYICEDVNTSYWPNWGGGHEVSSTFIEYMKKKIDSINAWYSKEPNFKLDTYSKSISSISFHPGLVIIKKGNNITPKSIRTGIEQIMLEINTSKIEKLAIKRRFERFLIRLIRKFV